MRLKDYFFSFFDILQYDKIVFNSVALGINIILYVQEVVTLQKKYSNIFASEN